MFGTLRGRLILSHIISLIVIIPLMGLALVYLLESQFVLTNLADDLNQQGVVIAQSTLRDPEIWQDAHHAQVFLNQIGPSITARVMLITPDGYLLASTAPADAQHVGEKMDLDQFNLVQNGVAIQKTAYSQQQHVEVADVLVPVVDPRFGLVGVVRLTDELNTIYDKLLRLRYMIGGVLVVALVVGSLLGLVFALGLERQLKRITQAVSELSVGDTPVTVPEQGPREIKVLAHAYNDMAARLHALEENRRQLLANVVHELGRPLGALLAAIQALLGGAAEDTALRGDLLTGMESEIHRLQRLLNDLAGMYDEVIGAIQIKREPLDLAAWLPGVLAPWKAAVEARKLSWTELIPPDLPTLDADPDRLGQALGNLLSNAIKYTPVPGVIGVDARVEGGDLRLRVSDTGPGIAPTELEHIFMPYVRGVSGKRFPQGMGLGLTIARDFVVAHGGRLEAESTLGEGSRFTVILPLKTEATS